MAHELDNHFIFEVVKSKKSKTGKSLKITTPSDAIRIHSKAELEAQLEHYSHPLLKHTVIPKTAFARKHYVEKIRPALRFYCKKYGVTVPKWLVNEDYYNNLDDKEKADLFGTTELSIREFRPAEKFQSAEASSNEEQG